MKNKILNAICAGITLQWISLFLSYRELPSIDRYSVDKPIATGGFPLTVFWYPLPPMGSDWPPLSAWPMFFLNLAIWIAFAALVLRLLDKKIKGKNLTRKLVFLAVASSLLGLFYTVLKFD